MDYLPKELAKQFLNVAKAADADYNSGNTEACKPLDLNALHDECCRERAEGPSERTPSIR